MTAIEHTGFKHLETEGRLLNALLKAPTKTAGRFGFRGDLALKFATKLADEARPPELAVQQVLAVGGAGESTIQFFAAYLLSFEYLKPVAEVLGESLSAQGKYFVFCNNVDLSAKYRVKFGDATFYVLPIDEATVYNEILDLLYIDRNDLKKLDTAGKLDAIADKAIGFSADFELISYEDGLRRMGPVRNPNENRPV
ncbi:MAG: hypothetical protein ABSF94_15710 [Steroidobacteraceae bacterium]|jgi:hypothetical protein